MNTASEGHSGTGSPSRYFPGEVGEFQMKVLEAINTAGGHGICSTEVTNQLDVFNSEVSRAISKLKERGFIEIIPNKKDPEEKAAGRPRIYLRSTPKGKKIVGRPILQIGELQIQVLKIIHREEGNGGISSTEIVDSLESYSAKVSRAITRLKAMSLIEAVPFKRKKDGKNMGRPKTYLCTTEKGRKIVGDYDARM